MFLDRVVTSYFILSTKKVLEQKNLVGTVDQRKLMLFRPKMMIAISYSRRDIHIFSLQLTRSIVFCKHNI